MLSGDASALTEAERAKFDTLQRNMEADLARKKAAAEAHLTEDQKVCGCNVWVQYLRHG